MHPPLTPDEYYHAALANSGLTPDLDGEAKLAEVAKRLDLPLEVAKIAEFFYDRFILDGIRHATPEVRRDDAVKLAKAYYEHQQQTQKTADAVVGGLFEALVKAAEAYAAATPDLAGIGAIDLVKLAAIRADDVTEAAAALQEKRAAFNVVDPTQHLVNPALGVTPDNILVDSYLKAVQSANPHINPAAGPHEVGNLILPGYDHKTQKPDMAIAIAKLHQARQASGATDFSTLVKNYDAMHTPKPSATIMGVNKNLLGMGVLGAGAMWYMNRRRREEEARREHERQMAAAMPRA